MPRERGGLVPIGDALSERADDLLTLDEIYRQQALGNYLGAFALVTVTLGCPPPLGSRHLRAHVLQRQPASAGDRDSVGPGGATTTPAGGHPRTGAGPGRGRGVRRRCSGAHSRLLFAGRRDGWLEHPGCPPRRCGAHDCSRPARGTRTGPSEFPTAAVTSVRG